MIPVSGIASGVQKTVASNDAEREIMSDFRRFFFDDGSSRKRWHIKLKGKSQVVQYGRLGGSHRESRKSFATPSEAAKQTEKLIAAKIRDGYIEIDPSR